MEDIGGSDSLRFFYLQYNTFLSLRDKTSVILTTVIPVHILARKQEIKTV